MSISHLVWASHLVNGDGDYLKGSLVNKFTTIVNVFKEYILPLTNQSCLLKVSPTFHKIIFHVIATKEVWCIANCVCFVVTIPFMGNDWHNAENVSVFDVSHEEIIWPLFYIFLKGSVLWLKYLRTVLWQQLAKNWVSMTLFFPPLPSPSLPFLFFLPSFPTFLPFFPRLVYTFLGRLISVLFKGHLPLPLLQSWSPGIVEVIWRLSHFEDARSFLCYTWPNVVRWGKATPLFLSQRRPFISHSPLCCWFIRLICLEKFLTTWNNCQHSGN